LHIAPRFERLLDAHRRPDGSRWTGQKLDEATGGVVTRSYVTNLRKDPIENPGYEKMRTIARAMGFPPEEEVEGIRADAIPDPTIGQVATLAAVFGVEPSYLIDRKEPSLLDAELLEGLSDETTREIAREALRLPERERGIVLGIVQQFGGGSPPRN
jgi:transcriptional regulator with XRE-family HTH domain